MRSEKALPPDYNNLLHDAADDVPEGLDVSAQLDGNEFAATGIESVPEKRGAGIGWYLAALLLLGGLAVQYAWYERLTYAQDTRFRVYYEEACRYLQCRIPEYLNPDALETANLVVRTHPDVEDALVVDAVIRNLDTNRQPFPSLQLSFTDTRNRVVARRLFSSAEYLAGEMRGMRFIPGRTEVRFSLEIHDPGKEAVGYALEVVPAG